MTYCFTEYAVTYWLIFQFESLRPRKQVLNYIGMDVPGLGLLRVSEYSDIRGSEFKIEYGYSSLQKSLDRDLFSFFFTFF